MSTTTTEAPLGENMQMDNSMPKIETDRGKKIDDISDFGPAPDGGTTAWLVAVGGACLFFCCLGFANSFGTFVEYYTKHQLKEESPDKIAWIGSLAVFLQFGFGLIGGPLFDRLGSKVMVPASVLYVFAVMMLSLCKVYWQIMLVQGVLMGCTMGLLQFPVFAAVSQWFDKRRSAVLGIVVAGSSIGGIVIPIALSKMLNSSSLGFAWSVRIIGFIMLPFVAFAALTVKPRLPPRPTNFLILAAYRDLTFLILIAGVFFMFMAMFTPLFYLPTYAVSRGMNATLAGYLLAILNATSTLGRIIPGFVADRYGSLNVLIFAGLSTGIVIFCMNSATSNASLIVYAAIFGFTSGAIISGASAAMSICVKDPRNMGTYMGMGMSLAATGCLIGPPVNGTLISHYGGYFEVAMLSGTLAVVGALIILFMKTRTSQGILGRT